MAYTIFTDTGSNYYDTLASENNVKVIPLPFIMKGEEYKDCDVELVKSVYARLRQKEDIHTSCANEEEIESALTPELEKGNDVVYLVFSSGLSATYQNALNVQARLQEKFPDRKIRIVDSLAAALGHGLLVTYACQLRDEGKTVDEVASWLEVNKMRMSHLFTVDSLFWLYRGGRISGATYALAKGLQIKPIMHTDDEGHLTAIAKAIGRKRSIKMMADKFCATIENPEEQIIYLGHGDCLEDALALQKLIEKKVKVKGWYIDYLCPTIGAHSGPGTLAIFYLSKHRI